MALSFPLIITIAVIIIFLLIFSITCRFLVDQRLSAGVRISLVQLFLMRLRRVPPTPSSTR